MKKNILKIFFLPFMLFLSGCSSSNGPAIMIDGAKYKFGEVTAGKDVIFTFAYSNPGTKDLIIKDLYVSCFCVVIKTYDHILKPGARGHISGVIKTKGFLGDISKSIKVETNIPNVTPILTLEGKILTPLAANPAVH